MKKINRTVYIADDGQEFSSSEECKAHETFVELSDKLDNDIYLRSDVDADEILRWIQRNKEAIKVLIQ